MQIHQKILIVDDKHENLVALRQVLRDTAAEVIEATNGNDALSATLDHSFALAILDVMMPGMNGFELAEHLRSDESTRSVPIIFLTALRPDEDHLFDGYQVGGVDFIVKPYLPEVLLAKAGVFLELDRKRQELQWHHDQLDRLVHERTSELEQQLAARKAAEAELQSKNLKLDVLLKVSTLRYEEKKSLSDEILQLVVQMTESKYGFYGFVNEDETIMTIHAWSGKAMQDCSISSKPCNFSIQGSGIWVEAIRTRSPLIVNDYSIDHPGKHGLPDGHVQLTNLLVVPLMQDNRIVSVAAVANRHTEYTTEDVAQVTAFLASVQSIVDRNRIKCELSLSNENLRLLTESIAAIPWTFNILQNQWTYVGPQATRILGYAPAEWTTYQWWQERIHPEDREWVSEYCANLSAQGKELSMEYRMLTKDGSIVWVYDIVTVQMGSDGNPETLHGILIDISGRKKAEEERFRLETQLHQSQKLESIGRLAGGVAHDFNNMLMIILGNTELALFNIEDRQKMLAHLKDIKCAAEHSRDITAQLLSFSRKQPIVPKVTDINATIKLLHNSLSRLIGKNITFSFSPGEQLWNVLIDSVQVDQIVVNMAVNARDAMVDGGTFTVETGNVSLTRNQLSQGTDCLVGDYVKITFSDNGPGIPEHILPHIFEPFFTTKDVGKGTGLGLATVYGIVQQNNGHIEVSNNVAGGAVFNVYLPRHDKSVEIQALSSDLPVSGKGTILLVEDESALCKMTTQFLQMLGYTVFAAESPAEAIKIAQSTDAEFDLILTDVIMPDMNGKTLVESVKAVRPAIKVIYTSGYTSDVISQEAVDDASFVQKPYELSALSLKISQLLSA